MPEELIRKPDGSVEVKYHDPLTEDEILRRDEEALPDMLEAAYAHEESDAEKTRRSEDFLEQYNREKSGLGRNPTARSGEQEAATTVDRRAALDMGTTSAKLDEGTRKAEAARAEAGQEAPKRRGRPAKARPTEAAVSADQLEASRGKTLGEKKEADAEGR